MERLEVSGAVRPLQWSLGVKWLSKWATKVVKVMFINNFVGHQVNAPFIRIHQKRFNCVVLKHACQSGDNSVVSGEVNP